MLEIIPSGTEEQEEEEEAVPALHPQGLRSRGPTVLAEAESAGQSIVAEGAEVAEQPKEVTERAEVEILSQPGVSNRPAASSAKERGMEAQQPGFPSVLMPTSWVVSPALPLGFSVAKPQSLRPLWFRCHLRHLNSIVTI